jgi:prolipoprotein diacylglyceryltransferase
MGGCQAGLVSNSPVAVKMAGLVGNRFPIQVFEFVLFLIAFSLVWRKVKRFHAPGKIFALSLVLIGSIKFIIEFFYAQKTVIFAFVGLGHIFSLLLIIAGIKLGIRKDNEKTNISRKTIIKKLE